MKVEQGPRPGEIAFGIVLLAFSAWALWQSYGISGFTSLSGAGVFPMLAAGVMLISGLSVVYKILNDRRGQHSSSVSIVSYLFPLRFIVFLPMVAGFALLMPWLGFFPSAALFTFISIWFLWRNSLLKSLGISAIAILAIYGIFRLVFQVVLPSGVFF